MRRTGISTRIIDQAIQDFFIHGYCWLCDHDYSEEAQKHTAKRFLSRLQHEHRTPPITLHMAMAKDPATDKMLFFGYVIVHQDKKERTFELTTKVYNEFQETLMKELVTYPLSIIQCKKI